MAVDKYTLGDIKRIVRNEFNIEDDADTNEFLNEQVNKAHLHIARQRGRWHWQIKEAVIDVPDSFAITVTATKGSRDLVILSGTTPEKRSVIVTGNSDYGTQGYIIENVVGSTLKLKRQWLSSSGTHTVNVHVGYVQLPDDFYAIDTTDEMSNIAGEYLRYFDNQRFQHVRNKSQLSIATDRIYTVLGDPINEIGGARFIAFYPYYGSMDSLYYSYYYVPPQLVTDNDEPILPVGDRPVLVDFTLWFVAQAKGYEKVMLYRDMATSGLVAMLDHVNEDASFDFGPPSSISLDMSATRGFSMGFDSDYNPNIV